MSLVLSQVGRESFEPWNRDVKIWGTHLGSSVLTDPLPRGGSMIPSSSSPSTLHSFMSHAGDEASCRGVRLLWLAKVYSFHLVPSQKELVGPKPQHCLLLWHQEPPCEVDHQRNFTGSAQPSSSSHDMVVGLGSPHGTSPCSMWEGRGKAAGRLRGGRTLREGKTGT